MAHITIEYSANLAGCYDIDQLVATLHQAACEHGMVPAEGVRTRAYRADHYVVADGDPDNAFLAIGVRIGPGRAVDEQASFMDTLMCCADDFFDGGPADVALSVGLEVIHERLNRNHVRTAMDARREAVRS